MKIDGFLLQWLKCVPHPCTNTSSTNSPAKWVAMSELECLILCPYLEYICNREKGKPIRKDGRYLSISEYLTHIIIRKTCLCNIEPLIRHVYIAKLVYAGVYQFFLFLLQNIDCGYSLEKLEKYQTFSGEIFNFYS